MEERHGFIHSDHDIRVLILFVLRRLPAGIDGERLAELVMVDGGFDYFSYKSCLADLVDTAHAEEREDGYRITEKGIRNCDILEDDLPFSVRNRAKLALAPVVEEMRRSAMIRAEHTQTDNGIIVELAMSDGVGNIFDLKILAADVQQAGVMEKNFRKNAERYYHRFIEALSE